MSSSAPAQDQMARTTTLERWANALTDHPGDAEDLRLQKRVAVYAAVAEAPAGLIWGLLYVAFREYQAAMVPLSFPLLTAWNLAIYAVIRRYPLFRVTQLLLTLFLPFTLMLALGGFVNSSAVIFWSLVTPLGALVYTSRKEALFWFMAFILVVVAAGILDPHVRSDNLIPLPLRNLLFAMNIAGPSLVAFGLLSYFVGAKNTALLLLRREQARSESLLLNVLPAEIAASLKDGGRTPAVHHESVSILFADLVDSTPLAERLSPEELVGLLNEVFTHFDTLTDRYGVEKISTSGDNYLVAAGVPRRKPDHAEALAAMALDMMAYARSRPGREQIGLRIGINTGPAVAGVVGQRKFHYDLWGDAVNLASRMESHSEPGRIQVSRSTYELIKHRFVCVPRGLVEIRGKGPLETWWLEGRQ
jgi:guanylate cyclase